jgi:outer membrane protein assembly factor BamD
MGKLMRIKLIWIFLLSASLAFTFFNACNTSNFSRDMETKERFRLAMDQYKRENYENAIENFRVLSYDRSLSYADSVQYFLAECYFMREQYIIAAAEYKDLIRFQTNSPLVAESRYKIALSYASISPKIDLDQKYTLSAIGELQTFIEFYPTHPRVRDAERKMIELRTKLALKEFNIANLYMKMGKLRSALVYYQGVLEKFHDSEFADISSYWIIQIYVNQKKYSLAKNEIEKFLQKYPNSAKKEEIVDLKKKIENL